MKSERRLTKTSDHRQAALMPWNNDSSEGFNPIVEGRNNMMFIITPSGSTSQDIERHCGSRSR